MKKHVNLRADWVESIEVIQSRGGDDDTWRRDIVESLRRIFPSDALVGTYTLRHPPDFSNVVVESAFPPPLANVIHDMHVVGDKNRSWVALHFGPTVAVASELIPAATSEQITAELNDAAVKHGLTDAIGIGVHPRPGVVFAMSVMMEGRVLLSRYEREVLQRLAMHLETGARLRMAPETVIAQIDSRGRIAVAPRCRHRCGARSSKAKRVSFLRAVVTP